jgi:hypothetical protein
MDDGHLASIPSREVFSLLSVGTTFHFFTRTRVHEYSDKAVIFVGDVNQSFHWEETTT